MSIKNTTHSYDDCPLEGCGTDMEGCIFGSWYGYCVDDNCYGLCSYEGECNCECHKRTNQ